VPAKRSLAMTATTMASATMALAVPTRSRTPAESATALEKPRH